MSDFVRGVSRASDAGSESVDVVIPVYNACDLTRRCLESLFECRGASLGRIYVHDNASDSETARMLDSLRDPRLEVHHAASNTGFGDAVNQGIRRVRSEWILVLNSDVKARSDFVSPLLEAMRHTPRLAAVAPAGNTFRNYDLSLYEMRSDWVTTYSLSAYAFLVRRSAFEEVGGFDPAFGLGFYEDADLSRRWVRADWQLGICPAATLHHEVHGSFSALPQFRDLLARNRELYHARWPGALRKVALLSREARLSELHPEVRSEIDLVLAEGGEVHWFAPGGPRDLAALQMHGVRLRPFATRRVIRRKRDSRYSRFVELWLVDGTPSFASRLLTRASSALGIMVRRFPAVGS